LAAGGIEDDDGAVLFFGPLDGALGDFDEVFFVGLGSEDGDVDLLGKFSELVDGGGAVEVECDEEGAAAFFFKT